MSATPGIFASDTYEDALFRAGAHAKASIIDTEESRTNVAYGSLTTPDKVEGIVLPTKGLIYVAFDALWKSSVLDAGAAAIFLNETQLKRSRHNGSPLAQEATLDVNSGTSLFIPLASSPVGLVGSGPAVSLVVDSSNVTTGQVLSAPITGTENQGGVCAIFAAAGTYDVSVQFKASSGSVTAKSRKLFVWVKDFT